jgi:enoyl-CoA hydratase/carnithine racemase
LAGELRQSLLTAASIERLRSIVEDDVAADAIVLESTAGAFCLGADPDLLLLDDAGATAASRARGFLEQFGRLLRGIESTARPVIALVDGAAAGGGVGLAAAADFVIATRRASFGLPETLLGVVPALVFPVLARRIGVPRARWMALDGETIDAEEALRLGLVDAVTDDPEAALSRRLRRLRRLDPRAVAAVKSLAARRDVDPAAYEVAAVHMFTELLGSPGTQVRLRRFVDGLAPWPEDETP